MVSLRYSKTITAKDSFHMNNRAEVDAESIINDAYKYCRQLTRRYAKTFYFATLFLPVEKQKAVFAVYALCRTLDNIVDTPENILDGDYNLRKLNKWKSDLVRIYNADYSDNNQVLIAYQDTIKHYEISPDLPLLLIDGITLDITKNRYQHFDELYEYAYKVASVVGLMTSEIFGYSDKKALDYAVDLGIAMQLTNILRDVGEDLSRNRIYLPMNELEQFKIKIEDLFNHKMTQNFKDFMSIQIERVRVYYRRSEKGIKMLSPESRLPVHLAHHNYSRILDKIIENDYQVFEKRAYVSKMEKIGTIPRVWWRSKK